MTPAGPLTREWTRSSSPTTVAGSWTAPAALEVLPGIADAVGDRVEVLLRLGDPAGQRHRHRPGARAPGPSWSARAHLYGLAAAGEPGRPARIDILAGELRTSMALCGAATLADLDRSLIRAARPPWPA